MINRLTGKAPDREGEEPAADYWEVNAEGGFFYVDAETARNLLSALGRLFPPRRLRFTDVFGSGVWVRTKTILCVEESTVAQRASGRRFHRARRDERRAERRPWEDDEPWLE